MGTEANALRIPFLPARFPYLPDNRAHVRLYHLLQGLASHYWVDLLFSSQRSGQPNHRPASRRLYHIEAVQTYRTRLAAGDTTP